MGRVSFVRLLLAHVTGSDLRCIPDPDLVSQILHQFDEPLAVARGLHANQHRRRQLLIEQLGVPRSMHQLLFPGLSRLRVQPRNLLPAGMEITPYNHHAKTPFFPASLILNTRLPGSNRAFALIQSILRGFSRRVGGRLIAQWASTGGRLLSRVSLVFESLAENHWGCATSH